MSDFPEDVLKPGGNASCEFFARVAEGEGEADVIIDLIARAIMADRASRPSNSPTNLENAERADMEPKVKPLEWVETIEGGGRYATAKTVVGNYDVFDFTITVRDKTRTVIGWSGHWNAEQRTATFEEAKAAAQQDFASRIRSCLLDKPEAVEGEPFAWYTVDKHGCDYMSRNEHNLRNIAADVHGEVTPLYKQPPAGAEVIERLCKALEAAETYVIDGVTTAKQNLEMNAAYPARKPRYEAELQEARDIYAECQAARRAAVAAAKDKP
ncbi:hypothetical protein NKZ03_26275 [Sinorhizobium meliloti]|uniref:hypothetical protein n=1 Tax=Rhizobium meliloti TaxID=382 RepID=UPI003D64C897